STRESSPRRRKHRATATTATTATLKLSSTPPAPRLRRRQRRPLQQPSPQQEHRYSLAPNHRASDDDDAEQHQRQRIRRIGIGQGTARGILDFVLGGGSVGVSGSRGGGLRQSMTAMSAAGTADAWIGGGSGADGDGGSAMMSGGDEEGLGLLRQQLSAVQRIRIEHERKDAAIAALRLEVATLRQQKEEMLALHRERSGEWTRLVKMEERCRRLEEGGRDTDRRWTREKEDWKKQLVEAQEQCRAERDRAEFRAGSMAERLNSELEGERARSRGLEEKLRVLEAGVTAAKDESGRLIPRLKTLEETNEALRVELAVASGRSSKAELELAQLNTYRPLMQHADSIDLKRAEAEDGLRAAAVELAREREALAAARQEAADLRLALDQSGSRLAVAETKVSREAAEVVARRASSELADIRGLLGEIAGSLARSTKTSADGPGNESPGWSSNSNGGGNSGAGDFPSVGLAVDGSSSRSSSSSSSARLISAVSAGVKGLLAERAAGASALREMGNRYSQGRREAEEASAGARERDAAHREQLVELRSWCESEVEAQRRAKKAAQTAADCALRDLSAAAKKISAFEKEKSRICARVAAADVHLSSLAEEASAAKTGLRLVARACAPLVERCRVLAAQKRLLIKWHGPATSATSAAAADGGQRDRMASPGCRFSGGAAAPTVAAQPRTAVLLVDELRSLVAALGRESREAEGQRQDGQHGRGLGPSDGGGSSSGSALSSTPLRSTGGDGGGSSGGVGGNGNTAGNPDTGMFQQRKQQQQQQDEHQQPLVSLRAVGIAAVAVQRLLRLAACRAARRDSARAASTARTDAARAAAAAAAATASAGGTTTTTTTTTTTDATSGCARAHRPPPPPSPTRSRPDTRLQQNNGSNDDGGVCDGNGDGGVISLGPRGSGGVAMLAENEIVPPPSMSLALSSLLDRRATDGNGAIAAAAASPASAPAPAGNSGGGGGGGGGTGCGEGDSAAARCLGLLSALVLENASWGRGWGVVRGSAGGAAGGGVMAGGVGEAGAGPSLLQAIAGGQLGHWWRLEKRGLVPSPPWDGRSASRVFASRCERHHGRDAWKAQQRLAETEEAFRLLGATRRGTAALARLAGEAETRLLESEARRLRAKDEIEALAASKEALRAALDRKSELVSFLEERVHMMEGEASGTVPAAALAGTEKALTESLAEVETLRVRSASLYAELAEASARRKREAKKALKGAQAATQEKAARAQLQNELLSLRSYVLRSEQTVQELQEEARRQARETGSSSSRRCVFNSGGGG
ncbi:unnamed protein product, partial [Pylaiella littoralis]